MSTASFTTPALGTARRLALVVLATTVTLGCGAAVSRANGYGYYDLNANVCYGTCFNGNLRADGAFHNVALGAAMMPFLTSGSNNVAFDAGALFHNTTGNDNLASGYQALNLNTTGSDNLAFGTFALDPNTTGRDNLASGYGALGSNTTGSRNLASGYEALNRNTTAGDNLASGYLALFSNTTGSRNLASGSYALRSNTTGSNNLASGDNSLYWNTTGDSNVASGFEALSNNTTGASNVAIGVGAGQNLTTGSSNIEIANPGLAADSRQIRIGTPGTQTAAFVAGVQGVSIPGPTTAVLVNSSGQLGTATSSSASLKEDIRPLAPQAARVLALRPVSYRYKPKYGSNKLQYGLIAEQVAKVLPALAQYGPGGKPTGVYYQELPALLLAELQSQSTRDKQRFVRQQSEIDRLTTQVRQLRALILHHH